MYPKKKFQPEEDRLRALWSCEILDTWRENEYDRVVFMAAQMFKVPIVAISCIDTDRQWFKAQVGLTMSQTPRVASFCAHTILQDQLLEIHDALCDPRFATNPLVVASPFIRFYAGVPLIGPDGMRIGALCIMDRYSRVLSKVQHMLLGSLAKQVSTSIMKRVDHSFDSLQ